MMNNKAFQELKRLAGVKTECKITKIFRYTQKKWAKKWPVFCKRAIFVLN